MEQEGKESCLSAVVFLRSARADGEITLLLCGIRIIPSWEGECVTKQAGEGTMDNGWWPVRVWGLRGRCPTPPPR